MTCLNLQTMNEMVVLLTCCQNQSVLETSSVDVATATESLAAGAKGGLLIPAISSSPPVSVAMIMQGRSWAQYSFYKYIACSCRGDDLFSD